MPRSFDYRKISWFTFAIALFSHSSLFGGQIATFELTPKPGNSGLTIFQADVQPAFSVMPSDPNASPLKVLDGSSGFNQDNLTVLLGNGDGVQQLVMLFGVAPSRDADGKITGQWTAGDMKGDWAGTQKVAAAPAATAGAAASAGLAGLDGNWDATISVEGQTEFKFGLVIKKNGDKLVPEVTGGGDLSIVEVETRDPDVVNMTATYQGQGPIPLVGKRINADEAGGKWEAGGYSGSWKVTRKK